MARVGVIAGVTEEITDRDLEFLTDEELKTLEEPEEPEYDLEILREVIDLSDLPPGH